jgi:uncharacterized protein
MEEIEKIYDLCSKTGAWYGVEILNFEQRNFLNDTVLHTVSGWGQLDAVKALVNAGADVNAKGDQGATPLFNAAMGGNADVVAFLLKSGADPRICNEYNRSVLDYAKNIGAPPSILDFLEKATSKKRKKR